MVVEGKEDKVEEFTQACDYWPDQARSLISHPAIPFQTHHRDHTFPTPPTTNDADPDGGRGRRRLPPTRRPVHQRQLPELSGRRLRSPTLRAPTSRLFRQCFQSALLGRPGCLFSATSNASETQDLHRRYPSSLLYPHPPGGPRHQRRHTRRQTREPLPSDELRQLRSTR